MLSTTMYSSVEDYKHQGATLLQTQIRPKVLDPPLQHHSEHRFIEINYFHSSEWAGSTQ